MSVRFPDDFDQQATYQLVGEELILLDNHKSMMTQDAFAPVALNVTHDENSHENGDWEIGWYDNEGAPGIFKRTKKPKPNLDVGWHEPGAAPDANDEFNSSSINGTWENIYSGDFSAFEDKGALSIAARDGGTGGIFKPVSDLQRISDSFSVVTKVQLEVSPGPDVICGIALAEGDSSQAVTIFGVGINEDGPGIHCTTYTDFATFSGPEVPSLGPYMAANTVPVHLRLDYNGSSMSMYYSVAGRQWLFFSPADFPFDPAKVGLAISGNQDGSAYSWGHFSWFRDYSVPVFD